MKLTLDPMPALRMAAKGKVNAHFDGLARPHRDAAYAAKRAMAAATLSSGVVSDALQAETNLRGITPTTLASLILSKPDLVTDRELHRQRVMAEIDAAATPSDLTSIVDKLLTS